jgi:hypothetical protein
MDDFENNQKEKEDQQDLVTMAIEEGTKDGAALVTKEDGNEKQLFDRYAGEVVEIDNNGTKWGIDPETGERTRVVEYGDLSEN